MSTLVAYISGHGFGHAVRVVEVLRALRRTRPDLAIAIRTSVPRAFLTELFPEAWQYAAVQLDVGVVQADSLHVDPPASLRAYADLLGRQEALIAGEVAALHALRPALIFADIPALAFDIAQRLGVLGVAMTNFSWDWIYADYVTDWPEYGAVVDALRASYQHSTLLLRLPMHGDLSAFPHIRDIPLVARTATVERDDVRRRLRLPEPDRLVVLSFGGLGIDLPQTPPAVPGVTYVVTAAGRGETARPSGYTAVSGAQLAAAGVRYEDLVAACDAVLTKPGYGIVADCIANGTPMVYTSRGRFPEYPVLVEAIEAHLPNAFISNADLRAGNWTVGLDAVFSQPRRPPAVATNGAEVAAASLAGLLE